jgi:hypothetical protein
MKLNKKCIRCNSNYKVSHKSLMNIRKFCSKRCACLSYKENNPPERQPAWKGGKYNHSSGYIAVRICKNYILEHRYIMEKHINRKLDRMEDVHHINGIKNDNRIENLIILTRAEHSRLHQKACSNLPSLKK